MTTKVTWRTKSTSKQWRPECTTQPVSLWETNRRKSLGISALSPSAHATNASSLKWGRCQALARTPKTNCNWQNPFQWSVLVQVLAQVPRSITCLAHFTRCHFCRQPQVICSQLMPNLPPLLGSRRWTSHWSKTNKVGHSSPSNQKLAFTKTRKSESDFCTAADKAWSTKSNWTMRS